MATHITSQVQHLQRHKSEQFFLNLPAVLASKQGVRKGEVWGWTVKTRDRLILQRCRGKKCPEGAQAIVQRVRRANGSSQYSICLPAALAHALQFTQGEVVKWRDKHQDTLVIRRGGDTTAVSPKAKKHN
jgi:hypothetical protein